MKKLWKEKILKDRKRNKVMESKNIKQRCDFHLNHPNGKKNVADVKDLKSQQLIQLWCDFHIFCPRNSFYLIRKPCIITCLSSFIASCYKTTKDFLKYLKFSLFISPYFYCLGNRQIQIFRLFLSPNMFGKR